MIDIIYSGVSNSEPVCFDFKIIEQNDGTQIIDRKIRTSVDSLNLEMKQEYMVVHESLAFLDKMKRQRMKKIEYERRKNRRTIKGMIREVMCLLTL